ncbi:hypothetical protein [Photobacterium aquae]|uniref:hypothetical protein n=1 Tax=Photobacterium aquae TaxID=1195763 RepID=UPI00069FB2A7|nr:hypothetical protein [Photobacterium aquae]
MTNRQLAWMFICQLHHRTTFTAPKLAAATGMNIKAAKRYIRQFESSKRIEATGDMEMYSHMKYRVISKRPIPGWGAWQSRKPNVRQRIWNSMRLLKTFGQYELQVTAQSGERTTRQYLRALEKARLIRRIPTADGDVFRLNSDLGPRHPEIRGSSIRCQNSGAIYPYIKEQRP